MKKEHEDYFGPKLHELMDRFNAHAQAACASKDRANDPVFLEKEKEYKRFGDKLVQEFRQAGYGHRDWDDLMSKSGVAKKSRISIGMPLSDEEQAAADKRVEQVFGKRSQP